MHSSGGYEAPLRRRASQARRGRHSALAHADHRASLHPGQPVVLVCRLRCSCLALDAPALLDCLPAAARFSSALRRYPWVLMHSPDRSVSACSPACGFSLIRVCLSTHRSGATTCARSASARCTCSTAASSKPFHAVAVLGSLCCGLDRRPRCFLLTHACLPPGMTPMLPVARLGLHGVELRCLEPPPPRAPSFVSVPCAGAWSRRRCTRVGARGGTTSTRTASARCAFCFPVEIGFILRLRRLPLCAWLRFLLCSAR